MAKKIKRRKMAMGGNIPVELEGGEMFQIPGMGTGQEVLGPSHGQGGVDMELPEGTSVYSDRITVDGKTLADRKKSRDRKITKLDKLLDDNPSDQLVKNTAKRKRISIDAEDEFDKSIMDSLSKSQQKLAYGTSSLGGRVQPLGKRYLSVPPISAMIPSALTPNGLGDVNASVLNDVQPLGVQTLQTPEISMPVLTNPYSPTNSIAETARADIGGAPTSATTTAGQEGGTSFTDSMGGAAGMAGAGVSLASSIFGAISNIMNTKANLEATKDLDKDYWEDFGLESLLTNQEAQDRVQINKNLAKDEADRKLAIDKNTQRARNRGSAIGLNQLRAMDMVTDLGMNRATYEGVNQLEQIFGSQLLQLLGQEQQIELQRDQATMSSKESLQDAEEKRIDNYYTQMGQDLAILATTGQSIGQNINKAALNYNNLNWLNETSPYFDVTARGTINKRGIRKGKE